MLTIHMFHVIAYKIDTEGKNKAAKVSWIESQCCFSNSSKFMACSFLIN